MQERCSDGQQHAEFAGPHAAAGSGGRTHPLQRQNKKRRGNQVRNFDDLRGGKLGHHDFFGPLTLNILSMRSVMRKPPTMLLVAATMAMVPRMAGKLVLCSPARMIAPTTAIASRALVRDIRGVWRSGETRRMTSKPMKPASINT